jgi:hypothetical protein
VNVNCSGLGPTLVFGIRDLKLRTFTAESYIKTNLKLYNDSLFIYGAIRTVLRRQRCMTNEHTVSPNIMKLTPYSIALLKKVTIARLYGKAKNRNHVDKNPLPIRILAKLIYSYAPTLFL